MQIRYCLAPCVRLKCLGDSFEDIVFSYRILRHGLHPSGCICVIFTLFGWCVVVYGLASGCFASCLGVLIFSYYTVVFLLFSTDFKGFVIYHVFLRLHVGGRVSSLM